MVPPTSLCEVPSGTVAEQGTWLLRWLLSIQLSAGMQRAFETTHNFRNKRFLVKWSMVVPAVIPDYRMLRQGGLL